MWRRPSQLFKWHMLRRAKLPLPLAKGMRIVSTLTEGQGKRWRCKWRTIAKPFGCVGCYTGCVDTARAKGAALALSGSTSAAGARLLEVYEVLRGVACTVKDADNFSKSLRLSDETSRRAQRDETSRVGSGLKACHGCASNDGTGTSPSEGATVD
eukprot:4010631-Amphidinium_carterae.1